MTVRYDTLIGYVLASLTAAGCATTPARTEEPWPILRRYAADDSSIDRPMRVVARDWAGYWQLGLPEIDVDWDREMVLVAALGPTPRPDVRLCIRDVIWNGTTLMPHVDVTIGGDGKESAGARPLRMWSPYELVIVPANDANVAGFGHQPPRPARRKSSTGPPLPGLR